jgi:hypothetical protein
VFDIGGLGEWGEIADAHVLDHALAKWGHNQLLCEMSSATWRRRIVSQFSCQTSREVTDRCFQRNLSG